MKKVFALVSLLLISTIIATGCQQSNRSKTARNYVDAFISGGMPVDCVTEFTKESDIAGRLGKPGEYKEKIEFADTYLVSQHTRIGSNFITITTYSSERDMEKGKEQFKSILIAARLDGAFRFYESGDRLALMEMPSDMPKDKREAYLAIFTAE